MIFQMRAEPTDFLTTLNTLLLNPHDCHIGIDVNQTLEQDWPLVMHVYMLHACVYMYILTLRQSANTYNVACLTMLHKNEKKRKFLDTYFGLRSISSNRTNNTQG